MASDKPARPIARESEQVHLVEQIHRTLQHFLSAIQLARLQGRAIPDSVRRGYATQLESLLTLCRASGGAAQNIQDMRDIITNAARLADSIVGRPGGGAESSPAMLDSREMFSIGHRISKPARSGLQALDLKTPGGLIPALTVPDHAPARDVARRCWPSTSSSKPPMPSPPRSNGSSGEQVTWGVTSYDLTVLELLRTGTRRGCPTREESSSADASRLQRQLFDFVEFSLWHRGCSAPLADWNAPLKDVLGEFQRFLRRINARPRGQEVRG